MDEITHRRNIQDNGSNTSDDEYLFGGERDNLLPDIRYSNPREEPKDRFKVVYIIFYLLGVGTLLPWNMFITAKDYFTYQLRNTSITNTTSTDADDQTDLQLSYESAVAIANMATSVVLQVINTGLAGRVSMKKRITTSLVLMILVFIITLIFTKIDVTQWQTTFYAVTIGSVVLASAASALLQSSIFGLAAVFPQKYTQAVMGGMGLGGVFASLAEIITLSLGGGLVSSAFWYFLLAVIVVIIALVAYLFLYRLEFAKYHDLQHSKIVREMKSSTSKKSVTSEYWAILKIVWKYGLCVAFIFFITLMLFPATTSEVQSVNKSNGSVWTGKYFLPLYCFLLFNMGDLIGRTLAGWLKMPKPAVTIPIVTVLRIAFIPLFIFCNAQPRNTLPVVFDSDVWPIVIMALFALTNGYVSTLALMTTPTLVSQEQTELAGTLMSLFMTIGLGLGSAASYGVVLIVKNV